MITIYVNNIFSQFQGELDGEPFDELRDELSYDVPGAKHSPRYQQGHWDGKIKLFYKNGRFFTGLISDVTRILDKHGIEYDLVDRRIIPEKEPSLKIKGITLRDYQKKAVITSIRRQRGVIKVPSGGGKTEIISGITAQLNLPTIIFVHRRDLMYQAKARLTKRLRMPIGCAGGGHVDLRRFNVVMMQTAINAVTKKHKKISKYADNDKQTRASDLDYIRQALEETQVFMVDECFAGRTHVMVDQDSYMRIEEIVQNPQVTQVLSYNLKKKQVEKKKIARKITKKNRIQMMHIIFYVNGQKKTLNCTPNHKVWVKNKGYVRADELKSEDKIKYLASFEQAKEIFKREGICPVCNEFHDNVKLHRWSMHDRTEEQKKQQALNMTKKRGAKWDQSMKEMGKRRRGKNNPVFRHPDTIKKISKSRKAAFNKLSEKEKQAQITRFVNAPKYSGKMNRPEKVVSDFNFSELDYNGNAKYKGNEGKFFKIKDPKDSTRIRRKIPDFIIKNQNKVIEVADREYWHTEEEMEKLKECYEETGIKCLILYADELKGNLDEIKKRIYTFIHNHTGIIKKVYKKSYAETTYNLEVEDNHNYFADGVLVSNCHHVAAPTLRTLSKKCKNAPYRFGFSATPYRDDNADIFIQAVFGRRSADITASQLIKKGYLVPPKIYQLKFEHKTSPDYLSYQEIYKLRVVENLERNLEIVKSAVSLLKRDKTVLIAVTRVDHGKRLLKLFHKYVPKLKVKFAHGGKDDDQRKDILNKLNDRKVKCVIATTIFGEGIDIPSLDSIIIAKAQKSKVDSLQLVGRVLRTCEEKEEGIVVDIYDTNCRYLEDHSIERSNIYSEEKLFEIKDIDSAEDLPT